MRQSDNIGNRIKDFDNLEVQTVGTFNEAFPECTIDFDTFDVDLPLEILGPAINNCRELRVGTAILTHKMYSDILYTLDRQDYHTDERDIELTEINGVPV